MGTLAEIADEVGVSTSLVSRVLSDRLGNVRVSADTRQRIVEVSRQRGYVPVRPAQTLVTRKSRTVALVSPEPRESLRGTDAWNSHYLHQILSAMELECARADYHCLFSHWAFDDSGHSHPRAMLDRSVDGVVLADFTRGGVVSDLISLGLPCVQIGSNIESSIPIDCYCGDLEQAIADAVHHLSGLGHRRLALFGSVGPAGERIAELFLSSGLSDRGLHLEVVPMGLLSQRQVGADVAATMLGRPQPPTAYIALSAPFAVEFAAAMAKAERYCPRDFSLISAVVNGWPSIHLPGSGAVLATIGLPNFEVARAATRALLARIQSVNRPAAIPRTHTQPCRMAWAESVGARNV